MKNNFKIQQKLKNIITIVQVELQGEQIYPIELAQVPGEQVLTQAPFYKNVS